MTPEEKANELYDKFFDVEIMDITKSHRKAKEYALIAVDEVIKNIGSKLSLSMYYNNGYWQEVKNEIEQL